MKLKKIFLILAALVAFSSALTAASDYEYLLGKYREIRERPIKEELEKQKAAEEMAEWMQKAAEAEENRKKEASEKEKMIATGEYSKLLDAYFVIIPKKNYLMMKTEVTQEQWQTVMGENPSKFKGENLPVENVSWLDCIDFCNKLSEKEGLTPCYSHKKNKVVCDFKANGYRLPTVDEWKYAAKGGQKFKYSGSDNLDEVGWYGGNAEFETHSVAHKKPNGYGLYDMSGNVMELCWNSFLGSRSVVGGSWRYLDWDELVFERVVDVDARSADWGLRIIRMVSK